MVAIKQTLVPANPGPWEEGGAGREQVRVSGG